MCLHGLYCCCGIFSWICFILYCGCSGYVLFLRDGLVTSDFLLKSWLCSGSHGCPFGVLFSSMSLAYVHLSCAINMACCWYPAVQFLLLLFIVMDIIVWELDEPPGLFSFFCFLLLVNGVGLVIETSSRLVSRWYLAVRDIEANGVGLVMWVMHVALPHLPVPALSFLFFLQWWLARVPACSSTVHCRLAIIQSSAMPFRFSPIQISTCWEMVLGSSILTWLSLSILDDLWVPSLSPIAILDVRLSFGEKYVRVILSYLVISNLGSRVATSCWMISFAFFVEFIRSCILL